MINHNNIEDYIIDYVSNELNEMETAELLQFIEAHPEVQSLLDDYQEVLLPEDTLEDIDVPDLSYLKQAPAAAAFSMKKIALWIMPIAIIGAGIYYFNRDTDLNSSDMKMVASMPKKEAAKQNQIVQPVIDTNKNLVTQKNNNTLTIPNEHVKYQRHSEMPSIYRKPNNNDSELEVNGENANQYLKMDRLNPIGTDLKIPGKSMTIYTQLIPESKIPQTIISQLDTEMEVTIGGRSLDLNLMPIIEIKHKLEDVKETINEKVENTSVHPNDIWQIIN